MAASSLATATWVGHWRRAWAASWAVASWAVASWAAASWAVTWAFAWVDRLHRPSLADLTRADLTWAVLTYYL